MLTDEVANDCKELSCNIHVYQYYLLWYIIRIMEKIV